MAKTLKKSFNNIDLDSELTSTDEQEFAYAGKLLNHLNDVLLVITRDLRILWASPSVFNEWGYKNTDLLSVSLSKILNPSSLRFLSEAFEKITLNSSKPSSISPPFETPILAKDGSTLWAEIKCSYMGSIKKHGPMIACCFRDTSLRKLIDDTMQENLNLLQLLIDSLPDAIFITDKNGHIEGVNRTFEDMIGMHSTTMTGKALSEIVNSPASELVSWLNTIMTDLEGGIKIPLNQVVFADGVARDIVFNKIPYKSPSGDTLGAIGIVYDMTERKMLEDSLLKETEELRLARNELSEKNAELESAYLELKETQAHILHQEKMASIGQLAAGVAHEINNPMGFISSNMSSLSKYIDKITEFMAMQALLIQQKIDQHDCNDLIEKKKAFKIDFIAEDIKDLIRESLDGAERVKKIVQDLKTFSRNDQLEYREADINECIESSVNIVWNELKYKATLVKEYGNLPTARCFPLQLNQVFMNLLVNAGHAIEESGELRIKTWNDDGWNYASVSDSGHGITPEIAKKIFEPFFTTKEAGKGTGLGLSITYDIIKKHGGDITVESEPGKGTTFTVRIPVAGVNFDD